mmetsp:Transcript_11399/g.16883  ORF Transcript_11399/g.16883 Transcript_11399/m.16883 type:complete len:151 (+) Transcript_11399:103-555(+)
MKIVLALLALFAFIAVIQANIWVPCPGDRSKDILQISKLTISPDPPVSNSDSTVEFIGRSTGTITKGNVHTVVYYEPFGYQTPFFEGDMDLCTAFDGEVRCPVRPGLVQRTIKTFIPAIAPKGGPYNGTIAIKDDQGNSVTCIVFKFDMQ